jgi:hypothetical protein
MYRGIAANKNTRKAREPSERFPGEPYTRQKCLRGWWNCGMLLVAAPVFRLYRVVFSPCAGAGVVVHPGLPRLFYWGFPPVKGIV